jgi:hypothetical protein
MLGKLWLTLLVLAITGGAALAQSAPAFTVAPASVQDPRNSYIAPQSAVYVVDNVNRQIVLCYPNTQNNVDYVVCTAPTKLP